MRETEIVVSNGLRVDNDLKESFHREIEVHAVNLIRESALKCPEVVTALENVVPWRKEIFNQADSFGVLQTAIVGVVGRSTVAQLAPKIREAFNQTIESVVSRVDPNDVENEESAAEIARIVVNSRTKGTTFLSEIEELGRKFNEDLEDMS